MMRNGKDACYFVVSYEWSSNNVVVCFGVMS